MARGKTIERLRSWLTARFRSWDAASRKNAAERAEYRASGGRGDPSREAAQFRHPQDGGLGGGGSNAGGPY